MEFLEADLNDVDAVTKACEGVEVIFHEAPLPSVPRSVKDPWASNDANINGTLRLLIGAVAAGVKRVIYAGPSSAYGETPALPKVETMLPTPISSYAVSKGGWRVLYAVLYPRLWAGDGYATSMYLDHIKIRHLNIRESSPNLRVRCWRVRFLPFGEAVSRAAISSSLRMLYTQTV